MNEDWRDGWLRWRNRPRNPEPASDTSAQTLYREFLRSVLSPGLRALGFTGSSGRYSLPAAGCWAQLGFQKSAYSDREEIRFTVNLLVASEKTWAKLRSERPYLPERPAPSRHYGTEVASVRIGSLLPDPADTWWRVYGGADLDAVARDALSSIEHCGLPWLHKQLAQQGCR